MGNRCVSSSSTKPKQDHGAHGKNTSTWLQPKTDQLSWALGRSSLDIPAQFLDAVRFNHIIWIFLLAAFKSEIARWVWKRLRRWKTTASWKKRREWECRFFSLRAERKTLNSDNRSVRNCPQTCNQENKKWKIDFIAHFSRLHCLLSLG